MAFKCREIIFRNPETCFHPREMSFRFLKVMFHCLMPVFRNPEENQLKIFYCYIVFSFSKIAIQNFSSIICFKVFSQILPFTSTFRDESLNLSLNSSKLRNGISSNRFCSEYKTGISSSSCQR